MENFGVREFQKTVENHVDSGKVSQKIMKGVCGYLQWTHYENFTLKFEVTDEVERWCQAVGDSKLYYNAYGLEELWKIGSYEFLN